ncbi:MAG: hypothetical protein ACTHOU_15790, partial [Aureliella sp.]
VAVRPAAGASWAGGVSETGFAARSFALRGAGTSVNWIVMGVVAVDRLAAGGGRSETAEGFGGGGATTAADQSDCSD